MNWTGGAYYIKNKTILIFVNTFTSSSESISNRQNSSYFFEVASAYYFSTDSKSIDNREIYEYGLLPVVQREQLW